MQALIQLSHFLYFLLCMIFFVFTFVYHTSTDASIHIHILLLFSFLLIPLFDVLINMFVKEKKLFNGRIFFAVAVVLFCYIGFYVTFGQNTMAERLSIYAYYLLIAGVIAQIVENIISSKKNKNA